jgi:hypothetical protein
MTRFILISTFLFLNSAVYVHGRIITVYNMNNLALADYSDIQTAHDNALNGDTLLVYPSEKSYSGLTFTKKIFLIGSGYISQNMLPVTLIAGEVKFIEGSDGSTIESFGGGFNITISNTNNILVSRNHLSFLNMENSYNSLVHGNLMNGSYMNQDYMFNIKSNCLVEASNNIIRPGPHNCGTSGICYKGAISIDNSSILHINNSIIVSEGNFALYQGNASGRNNLVFGGIRWTNIDFQYSIHSNPWAFETILDTTRNNFIVGDINDVYIDFANSDYKLKPGSIGIGNGENNSNISIYAGYPPFIDGGYPSIPSIYHLEVPLNANQKEGLNITIKAKSNL